MKKVLYVLTIFALLIMSIVFIPNNVEASTPLDSVKTNISKDKITPGEQVTVTVDFGTQMGAYTISVAYDNSIFDYVSSEGGTPNDQDSKVKLVFYDSSGGSNTRNNATIKFKAKESIITSNPTNFAITLEGMANGDASVTYNDILVPIENDILVEPNYEEYKLSLNYEGNIQPNIQKSMTLITQSSMGKNYDNLRMTAEVTKRPSDSAIVKLLAKNEHDLELDLIQNGWGEPDGYSLGGKDVKQELALKGEFSESGKYTVNIKIVDRDDSDAVVTEQDFSFIVNKESTTDEKPVVPPEEEQNTPSGENSEEKPNTPSQEKPSNTPENTIEEMPETLPKTGHTQYMLIFLIMGILTVAYIFTNRRKD